jgi:hypothetical protein
LPIHANSAWCPWLGRVLFPQPYLRVHFPCSCVRSRTSVISTMSAPPGSTQNLPLDDRSAALKIPIIVLICFSSIFVLLRLGVSFKNRNFFLLTDHFLWTGHVGWPHGICSSPIPDSDKMQVIAIAGAACCYRMADYGGGKHIYDPVFKNPANLEKYLRFLWLGQILNLYGMALVKLSICAYIFMLNFSKSFRALIWVSVVIHIGLNFIFPTIILFGECTPYTKHWDVTGTQPGHCWSTKPKVISGKKKYNRLCCDYTHNAGQVTLALPPTL